MIKIQVKDGVNLLKLYGDDPAEKSLFEYINTCLLVRTATDRPASDASMMIMGAVESPKLQ